MIDGFARAFLATTTYDGRDLGWGSQTVFRETLLRTPRAPELAAGVKPDFGD